MDRRRQRQRLATVAVEGDDACVSCTLWQQALQGIPHGAVFEDAEFPATQLSIDGKEAQAAPAAAPAPPPAPLGGGTPLCRCGSAAAAATVQSDTPNKGRKYFHCPTRACGFFAWADGGQGAPSRDSSPSQPLTWTRLPSLVVVSDFGFRAADLRQGGVGDCWFLSALAVVAERHDLIARLFADTAPCKQGCYGIRFFLDGEWTCILIDDRLPVSNAPRRPGLAFDSKLAFSRCGS